MTTETTEHIAVDVTMLNEEQTTRVAALLAAAGVSKPRSTGDLIYVAEWIGGGPPATDDPMERDDEEEQPEEVGGYTTPDATAADLPASECIPWAEARWLAGAALSGNRDALSIVEAMARGDLSALAMLGGHGA